MEMLVALLAISTIIWYITDRFKPAWEGSRFGSLVTMGFVAILSVACVFGFGLDLIAALMIVPSVTLVGQVLTVLALMTGSSAVSEIIGRIKGE